MIVGSPSQTDVESVYVAGETGQVAVIEVRIDDNQGNVVFGPTNPDRELGTTGVYVVDLTLPATEGQYTVIWTPDGSFDADTNDVEDLLVVAGGAAASIPPIVEPDADIGPTSAPCTAWTTSEEAAACCGSANVGSDTDLFDDSVVAASGALYMLSGQQFPGACIDRVVRPCDQTRGCGLQTLPSGYVIGWDGHRWSDSEQPACSCQPLSRILLPNFPVDEIVEVKIDGDVLDPDEYRLDSWRYLTRLPDADGRAQSWPSCQRLDKADTEDGTFSVRYLAGKNPPPMGVLAAKELACQIYLACSSDEEAAADCVLPAGVATITRQGVTLDLTRFTWSFRTREGWKTGLPMVDLFLNSYNPHGLKRPPMIWSPDARPAAEEVGTVMGS